MEDLKSAIEMIQKHIESMGDMAQEEDEEEKEEMAEDSKEEETESE